MSRSSQRLTAALLIGAAVLANLAFIALGSAFDYPAVLQRPAGEILEAFSARQVPVSAWFASLALSAALLAPVAILVGRLSAARTMRLAVATGVAAAGVQVVGLMRWPLLVPGIADRYVAGDAAARAVAASDLETIHRVLGTLVGETFGYLLTAAWTILVLVAFHQTLAGRWFTALGVMAAVMIATGVLVPLGFASLGLVNFLGYALWSVWLVALAIVLVRDGRSPTRASELALAQ